MTDFIDPTCIPDVFAGRLAMIEEISGVTRLTFTTSVAGENIVVSRLILLPSALEALRKSVCRGASEASRH